MRVDSKQAVGARVAVEWLCARVAEAGKREREREAGKARHRAGPGVNRDVFALPTAPGELSWGTACIRCRGIYCLLEFVRCCRGGRSGALPGRF